MVDLRNCKKGDLLLSSHGAILEYIAPTPYGEWFYLDHVVRYVKDRNGNPFPKDCFGTRTHDGFVFAEARDPEKDNDIIEILC